MTISIIDVVKSYKGLPHQDAALKALEDTLGPYFLADDQKWVKLWRTPQKAVQKPTVQSTKFDNSWDGMKACAVRAGAKFPEVVAAQWALESARGTILSGKNNFFGIKGAGTVKTTWEDYGNGAVIIQAAFKDFATPYDCVEHLVNQWYKDYKGYKGVNRARTREECARLLKAEGYATDPLYSQKLISLINSNEK
jgi:flagellum-specific peptidoglycan hydrolase FlgJ